MFKLSKKDSGKINDSYGEKYLLNINTVKINVLPGCNQINSWGTYFNL